VINENIVKDRTNVAEELVKRAAEFVPQLRDKERKLMIFVEFLKGQLKL
jgi:hypothetical protein